MTTPQGNPEANAPSHAAPEELTFDAIVTEQSPVSPTFDELTRQRAKEIIALYPDSRSALLPLLHLVQSVEGYASRDGIRFCAEALDLSLAEVTAVVTFYTMYKRTPCGEHLVSVCTNTLCAALGGDAIYEKLQRHLGTDDRPLGHEETVGEPGSTGSLTIEHAECLAACDLAPVVQVNYEYFDNQTVDSATELVDALRRGERPQPTRGAPLTDLRTVELELAGFPPDQEAVVGRAERGDPAELGRESYTVEGPSPAIESVRGARLAEERGWTAPAMPDEPPAMPALPEKK